MAIDDPEWVIETAGLHLPADGGEEAGAGGLPTIDAGGGAHEEGWRKRAESTLNFHF